jgi:hypothetical protein
MSNTVSKLFSQAGTGSTARLASACLPWRAPAGSLRDIHFLRSWIELDAQKSPTGSGRRINWGKVLGLMLVVAVSGGFWTGVGLLVVRFWK